MGCLDTLRGVLLDALFPPVCASCKKEGDFLCAECMGSLARRKIRSYGRRPTISEFQNLDGVVYALDFAKNPQIQAAIHQFKYKFTEELARPFAKLIAEKIGELGMAKGRPLVLIPVPLHPRRLRERGFNQAEVIARAVQAELGTGRCEVMDLLIRKRETAQQARLNREGRSKNLEDAFSINHNYCHSEKGRRMNNKFVHKCSHTGVGPLLERGERNEGAKENVIKERGRKKGVVSNPLYFLVDDVCTTGTTLDECAKALKASGISKVYGLVIARALRDSHSA